MHIFYGQAATWLAEQEAGERAGDPTFLWALEKKWQAVMDHLERQRKLAFLARRLDEDVETFQPTDDPEGAWVREPDLRQILATPPREVIERFEGRRQEEADRSAAQQQARQAVGRYRLWDAAMAIGDATATPFERVLDALLESANAGELTTYQGGATFPHKPEGPLGALSGDEAYWSDLNAWMQAHKLRGEFAFPEPREATRAQPAPAKRPLQQQRYQEQEILRALKELGYDPMNLPRQKNRKATSVGQNAKQDARSLVKFPSSKVFDLAWERLRHISDRRIKYADES